MREFVIFNTTVGRQRPPRWQDIAMAALQSFGPAKITPSPYGDRGIKFEFDYYPEGLDAVVDELRHQRISASFSVRRQYTAADRRQAELLILGGGRIVRSVEGTLHRQYVSICPFCACRTADWQFAPLRIAQQPQGAMFALVDHWPLVVSAELAQALQEAQVTGLELVPVGPDRPAQWYGVRVTHRLPPVAIPPTRLSPNRGPTPQCAPNHLWDGSTHSQLTYRRQGLAPADFNRTYEYYGHIGSAVTRVVISQRVYRLLREVGVKRLDCAPIRIVD